MQFIVFGIGEYKAFSLSLCVSNLENKKVALLILDGLGYGKDDNSNAVRVANTPFLDNVLATYTNSPIDASGEAVGLPEGQMRNSEVGHMNLDTGRTVYHELGRINKAASEGEFNSNAIIQEAFEYAKANGQ